MVKSRQSKIVLTFLILISMSVYGFAANTDDVAALKQDIAALQAKVAELEKNQANQQPALPGVQPPITAGSEANLYDPFAEMEAMQRRMDSFMIQPFGAVAPGMAPRIGGTQPNSFYPGYDIKGTDKSYVVTFDLPGMDKSKINVQIKNSILMVSGERSVESEANDSDNHFYRRERNFGYFSRTIPLPKDAKADSIQAKYDNGILTVTIDKKETSSKKEDASQKIEVK